MRAPTFLTCLVCLIISSEALASINLVHLFDKHQQLLSEKKWLPADSMWLPYESDDEHSQRLRAAFNGAFFRQLQYDTSSATIDCELDRCTLSLEGTVKGQAHQISVDFIAQDDTYLITRITAVK